MKKAIALKSLKISYILVVCDEQGREVNVNKMLNKHTIDSNSIPLPLRKQIQDFILKRENACHCVPVLIAKE